MPPDVGIVWDGAARGIECAMWIFGQAPWTVYAATGRARGETDDFAAVTLGFGGGRVATVHSGWTGASRTRSLRTVLEGGEVRSDLLSQVSCRAAGGNTDERPEPLPAGSEIGDFLESAGRRRPRPGARPGGPGDRSCIFICQGRDANLSGSEMNRRMMEILACPIDKKSPLELDEIKASKDGSVLEGALFCPECTRFYPIIEGIPIMLPDDLRDKGQDMEFLKRNQDSLPERITASGQPWHL